MPRITALAMLLAMPVCAFALPSNLPKGDSTISTFSQTKERSCVTVDVGFSSAGAQSEQGWGTPWSVRAGFGTPISHRTMLFCYVDYYEYHAGGGDFTVLSPTSARRMDVAAYASIRFHDVVVMGAGVYYTKSDPVDLVDMNYYRTLWQNGNLSELRFFYVVGAAYPIHIIDRIFLPVGLFFRQSYGDRFPPIFLRTGVEVQL